MNVSFEIGYRRDNVDRNYVEPPRIPQLAFSHSVARRRRVEPRIVLIFKDYMFLLLKLYPMLDMSM